METIDEFLSVVMIRKVSLITPHRRKKKNHSCACMFKRKKPDKRQRLRQRTGENVTEAKKDVSGKLKTIYKQISQETSMSMKRTGKG